MTQSNSKKKGCGCLPLLGVIFLAGLGGGYFLFRNYLGEELTHYSGAKIIPEEAVMTSFISTNSSDWSNLNQFGTAEAKKIINNNLQELEKEIITDDDSINYQKDIQPWLGGIMVTLLPSKTEKFNYDLALILGIKNKLKAWQFIEKITKDSEVEVEKKKYKDLSFYKYQETQNNTFFLSQFKNYLVLTSNQNTLEEIIDTFKGENSLANQENFNSTLNQKVTIKKPLMQIYLPDYEQLIQNAIKHSLSSKNEQPITTKKSTEIHSIVMSMGIEDNGIHFQALADLPDYLDENKLNELNSVSNQLIKNIPENTIFMINGSGINQAWQAIEKQKKLIPDLNDFINYGEDFANQWFNIDLATDIFSWINQEFAVGVLTLDNSSSEAC